MLTSHTGKTRKGQFFSYDAIMGALIFVIAFALLITYWWSIRSTLDTERDDMLRDGLRISDGLKTPGNPSYWNTLATDKWKLIGFANSTGDSSFQDEKLTAFKEFVSASDVNYIFAKEYLLRTPYNFRISIESNGVPRGCGLSGDCIMGKAPENARNQVIVTRVVNYKGSLADLKIVMWV